MESRRSRLEAGNEPIRYPLRGSIRSIIRVNLNPALNTEILTFPLNRFRLLARDYERLPETLAGLHFVVFAMLMLVHAVPVLQGS